MKTDFGINCVTIHTLHCNLFVCFESQQESGPHSKDCLIIINVLVSITSFPISNFY